MANNSIISQQLNMLASLLENSEKKDIPVSVLTTCGGLIEIVSKTLRELNLDKDTSDEVFISTEYVSASLSELAEVIKASPDIVPSTEAIKKLSEEKEKSRNFIQEIAKAEMELPSVIKENEKLSAQAKDIKDNFDAQKATRDSLKASLENYSDEVLNAISKQITELSAEIAKRETEKKSKEALLKSADDQLTATNSEINRLQKKIDAHTDAEKAVAQDLKDHEDALRRLEEAKNINTPEKQQQLKNDTAEIDAQARKLTSEIAILKEQKDKAKNTVFRYHQDKESIETDVLSVITDSMTPLKDIMKSHTDKLNEIKKDAESLKKSLAEAKAIRDQYAFMLDNDKSTYEAMANAIGVDHRNLKETLDITKSGKIAENIRTAQTAIETIDQIIAECAKACALDNDNTVKMATSAKK